MEKSTKYGIVLFAIVIIVGFMLMGGGADKGITGNVVAQGGQVIPGETQRVVLSQDGYNYRDAVVEAGKPIELSADSSVGGCLRSVSFNIEGKRYNQYLRTPDETMQLPALSKGTYNFACSMGMGFGKLIVE